MAKTRVVSGDLILGLLFVGFLIAGAVGVYFAVRGKRERLSLSRPGTFDNNDYQVSPPSTHVERSYTECVRGKCEDQDCLDNCYLQIHRQGMLAEDLQGKICRGQGVGPEQGDDYYRCLEHQYTDNTFM